jgi:glutamine phosphoribosylpyrophosphate amidotransferase
MSSVTGIFSNNGNVIEKEELPMLLYSFNILQDHRGQAGAGAVMANPKRIKRPCKDRGPARSSTPLGQLKNISDHTMFAGIGHTCYAKDRFLRREDIHPIRVYGRDYEIYVASDGILLDKAERKQRLVNKGYMFGSNTNGAVIGTMFSKYMDKTGDEFEAGRMVIDETFGSGGFSTVLLARKKSNGKTKIVAIKDKRATKPLCYGEANDTFFVASESYPLQNFGVEHINRVRGGDVVVFSENGIEKKNYGDSKLEMPCVFEQIYFGGPEALVLEDLGPRFPELAKRLGMNIRPGYRPSNFTVRSCLGLAWHDYWKDELPAIDLVSPIVESGKGVTEGMAAGLGVGAERYSESMLKTLAYRTFQLSDPEERWLEVMLKLKLIIDKTEGKRMLIGDDSIVRGGVSGLSTYEAGEMTFFPRRNYGAVGQLKTTGRVSEILMGISYAPMYFQCYYEFESMEKRAAEDSIGKPLIEVCDDVAKKLETDWEEKQALKVRYNPLGNVYDVCGRDKCAACANGCYPVDDKFVPDVIKERRERFTDS